MKNIKKAISNIALTLLIISGGSLIASQIYVHKVDAAVSSQNYITKLNISTGITVGTSSVQLLAPSSGRTYAAIVNDSTNVIYISLDGNPAVVGQGIRLNASGGSYEIDFNNQIIGVINAIASGAGSNVTVTAYQ